MVPGPPHWCTPTQGDSAREYLQVVKWAQQDSFPISKGIRRKVLFSRKTLYTRRLYHTLGADLWILKSRQSLKRLLRCPASYVRGQVRLRRTVLLSLACISAVRLMAPMIGRNTL